ncbi:MAG: permease [Gemmatimonadota bacterium]
MLISVLHHVFGMAWKVAWGLVLGFAISGAVQAFVSKERIAESLGSFAWKPLLKATGFGAASSSCSYAAAAMSKTLFQKGAHLVNATAFLVASTNLVLEIGLVLWTLMGWPFVAAELVGGILLISVMTVFLGWLAPQGLFKRAREHVRKAAAEHGDEHQHGAHHDHGAAGGTLELRRLFTKDGMAAVGRYFVTDWRMVGKDVVLGLTIAGALAALVPREWWATLFLTPSDGGSPGLWVTVENAVIGPVIALLSFVCSVGNIPLAAVLWQNGISFGGVVAFIFADLVTIPMVLVYRRYYGWKPALAFAGYLFVAIVLVGLMVDGLFVLVGAAPEPASSAATLAEVDYFAWDYTTWLNIVLLPFGIWLAWRGTRAER